MTLTAEIPAAPARRNPHLDAACPAWCRIDHSERFHESCIGSGGGTGQVWARAIIASHSGSTVSLTGLGPADGDKSAFIEVAPTKAEDLAVIVGLLADDTPEQHRELAAAIRRAAAALTGPRDCSRCDGCGQLADTDDREPWTAWTSLPVESAMAVLMGFVTPVPCDVCGGTGKVAGA